MGRQFQKPEQLQQDQLHPQSEALVAVVPDQDAAEREEKPLQDLFDLLGVADVE